MMSANLRIAPGPHISQSLSTRRVMLDVLVGLLPAMIAAGVFFRMRAAVLICVCVAACMITERLCNLARRQPSSIGDLSASVTGVILAFSVPPMLPWWAAVVGSVFAIAIGKMVFGGLGANIFNPAMVGRCFLTACYGVMMTTWTVPLTMPDEKPYTVITQANAQAGTDAVTQATPNAITQATPLAWSKQAIKAKETARAAAGAIGPADIVNGQLKWMAIGQVGGCLGETSAIALLIGGIYMLLRKTITWHIPVAMLGTSFAIGLITHLADPAAYVTPWAHLVGGGMMIGALFIATDPATSPLTKKGELIFGAGVGGITMLIRLVGEYPEGVMFAVLLMNAVTPLIDRFVKIVPAGGVPGGK